MNGSRSTIAIFVIAVLVVAGSGLAVAQELLPATQAANGDGGLPALSIRDSTNAPIFWPEVQLTVVEESLTFRHGDDFVHVLGAFRNDGDLTADHPRVSMAILDGDGLLVGSAVEMAIGYIPTDSTTPYFREILPAGEVGWFSGYVSIPEDVDVGEILFRASGWETDEEPGPPILELVDEWTVEETTSGVSLSATVRSIGTSDVIGLNATVALTSPDGFMLAVERIFPRAETIGGYLGGVPAGEEVAVSIWLSLDYADVVAAEMETRLSGQVYGGGSFRYGVVGLAHSPGANGSTWRSSLTLTNRSGAPAGVALRYEHADGREEVTLELEDGETFHRDDVVQSFFGVSGSSAGYVQIASSAPLTVTGRTSNETNAGGFGQALPAYTPEMTRYLMGGGVLSGLRGGGAFRSNIGFVNMGGYDCKCDVSLYAPDGEPVWELRGVEIGPTSWLQLNAVMPAGVEVAHAVVNAEFGCWMWAYASVIEEASGDPTTIVVELPTTIDLTPSSYRRYGFLVGSWEDQEVPEPPRP